MVDIILEHCPHCGSALKASGEAPEIHQQIALVEKPFIVTEYRCHQYWCETGQTYHSAPVPAEAQTGLFAPNLIALIAYLKGYCHVSSSALQDFWAVNPHKPGISGETDTQGEPVDENGI